MPRHTPSHNSDRQKVISNLPGLLQGNMTREMKEVDVLKEHGLSVSSEKITPVKRMKSK